MSRGEGGHPFGEGDDGDAAEVLREVGYDCVPGNWTRVDKVDDSGVGVEEIDDCSTCVYCGHPAYHLFL